MASDATIGQLATSIREVMVTLYDTLGVRENATAEEIKRAYRKAAMRVHPDRNVGREAAAHARFQQIKEAYAILSDPEQRSVYDAVFAQEMQRIERRREQERRRAEEEAARREAEYNAFVVLAMRFAERGHNRDVIFGVLLGRECEALLAARIADGVAALQASRAGRRDATGEFDDEARAADGDDAARTDANAATGQAQASARPVESPGDAHANFFSTLWHGMFGFRP